MWGRLGSAKKGEGVIGQSVSSYWQRKEIKEKEEDRKHLAELRELIKAVAGDEIEVELSHTKGERFVEQGRRKLVVHLKSDDWPRSSVERRRAQRIMIPLKVAAKVGATSDELLKILDRLLL